MLSVLFEESPLFANFVFVLFHHPLFPAVEIFMQAISKFFNLRIEFLFCLDDRFLD